MNRDRDDGLEATPPLDPAEQAELEAALVAAARPATLDERRHLALLDHALLDPLAEPSPEELRAASELRRALDEGSSRGDAALARALSSAFYPGGELEARRASARELARALPKRRLAGLGVAAALALAAAAALRFSPAGEAPTPELATSRSLSPLFARDAVPTQSARLDRIVAVRSRELRDNRFASWGVR